MSSVFCFDQFYGMCLLFYLYTVLFVVVGLENVFNNSIGKRNYMSFLNFVLEILVGLRVDCFEDYNE